ncbi:MAG: phosphoribosylformylglycinamidine cyclo-ligase [Vampirovibrio sp.]
MSSQFSQCSPASDEAYREAGVDLDRAKAVVDIAKDATTTQARAELLLGGIGGFSGAFRLPKGYESPVLLAATDGVGTKLELAQQLGRHDGIGIDLVAMSVNDLLTQGGEPLVFLDYFATERIEPEVFATILKSIAGACQASNCALVGGETAEMPGFYAKHQYDLAGFAVGVVEEAHLLPKSDRMVVGDVLLGVASSGPHANGYSLIRHILKQAKIDADLPLPYTQDSLYDALLMPTRLYVKPILALLQEHRSAIKGMVHMTGGGFQDNLPRILPPHLKAVVNVDAWPLPPVFQWLAEAGNLEMLSLLHTFNAGIGFVLCVSAQEAPTVKACLSDLLDGEVIYDMGHLAVRAPDTPAWDFKYLNEL